MLSVSCRGSADANRLEPGEGGPSVAFLCLLSCDGLVRTDGLEPAGEAGSSIPWLSEAEEVFNTQLFSSLSSRIRLLDDLSLGHPPRGGSHTCSSDSILGMRRERQIPQSTSDSRAERPAIAIGKTEEYGGSLWACRVLFHQWAEESQTLDMLATARALTCRASHEGTLKIPTKFVSCDLVHFSQHLKSSFTVTHCPRLQ